MLERIYNFWIKLLNIWNFRYITFCIVYQSLIYLCCNLLKVRALTSREVQYPRLSQQIAEHVAAFHKLKLPLSKEGTWFLDSLQMWVWLFESFAPIWNSFEVNPLSVTTFFKIYWGIHIVQYDLTISLYYYFITVYIVYIFFDRFVKEIKGLKFSNVDKLKILDEIFHKFDIDEILKYIRYRK